ncbi:MAG: type IX secretion system protein PorQ [Bacteroidales bacterium]|nr:type IX secretion system protein PorQ [Bacteroidales bacterium]
MLCLTGFWAVAQTGGTNVFNILSLPSSARQAALGGRLLSVWDDDAALAPVNPSLLRPEWDGSLNLQCVDYFSGAFYGNADYLRSFRTGTFRFGVQAMGYGRFDAYDIYGNEEGSFSAGDYVLSAGYGRDIVPDKFSMGMNAKTVFSYYETYFSAGLAVDVAASYRDTAKALCVSLAAVNIGAQLVRYADEREYLPLDVQLAVSRKLEHLPARFHFVFHHLTQWNLRYNDPTDPYVERDVQTKKPREASGVERFVDNAFRHFILGLEVQPAKALSLQVAYNYDMRREMRLYNKPAAVGLSYGVNLHIRKFSVQYARVHNHLASVPNCLTLSTNLNSFSH